MIVYGYAHALEFGLMSPKKNNPGDSGGDGDSEHSLIYASSQDHLILQVFRFRFLHSRIGKTKYSSLL